MKTTFQIHRLFSTCSFHSPTDWEMIQSFCQKRHHRIGFFHPSFSDTGLTAPRFVEWYDSGYGAGDFAFLGDMPVVVKDSQLDMITLAGQVTDAFQRLDTVVPENRLKHVPEAESDLITRALAGMSLEYSRNSLDVTEKHVPSVNDRVSFYSGSVTGLGIVRNVACNDVELYCYYIYETKELGYSMHEKGVVDLQGFHFEPMDIVELRRLNRELERVGKTWYDKLHRIEPLQVKADKGQAYWYISDKMKLVKETEKGTPTSNLRYIAGNYFTSQEEALDILGKLADLLKDRLAK